MNELEIKTILMLRNPIKTQFIVGNFLETKLLRKRIKEIYLETDNSLKEAMHQILKENNNNEILEDFSGKKSNKFYISKETEQLIDNYITTCSVSNFSDEEQKIRYTELLDEIIKNESNENLEIINFKHDVDILFRDKLEDIIYYVEVKYNDDHDTGKFVDINRKFLKTYAYLVRSLQIYDRNKFRPILFYFTNKRMKGNIYVPETESIYRGTRFFEKFTNVSYEELEDYMLNISEDTETIEQFNELYRKITQDYNYSYSKDLTIYSVHEDGESYSS